MQVSKLFSSKKSYILKLTNWNIKTENKRFGNMVKFKYLGRILANQNYSHDEVNSSLKSGNACCHSVQDILSSSLALKNVKIEIYIIIIFFCCFMWVVRFEGGT